MNHFFQQNNLLDFLFICIQKPWKTRVNILYIPQRGFVNFHINLLRHVVCMKQYSVHYLMFVLRTWKDVILALNP